VIGAWVASALAGEGMWLPEQMPGLADELSSAGFVLPAASLADPLSPPLSAIAGLGFCSASFVSPDGLALSNLHCIEGFVALNSTGEHNWLEEGFTAASREAELPAGPSARLYVLESVEDVTETVRAEVFAPSVTDAQRVRVRDRTKAALISRCEKKAGRRCEVAAFDGGQSYRLIRNLELKDVRIVHNPSDKVGYFGGDLDNFEWPRHDADYGIIRAYVGKNGKPAAPSPKNVPYQPKSWLALDPTGAQEGEPVMVIGYPGKTVRLALPEELHFEVEVVGPAELEVAARIEAIVAEERARSPEADRHLQSFADNVANGRKYTQGIQDNVGASTVLRDKEELAAKVDALVAQDQARQAAVAELRALVAQGQADFVKQSAIGNLFHANLLQVAHTAYRWSKESEKKDLDRDPGYQNRDREDTLAWLAELDEGMWLPAERLILQEMLERALALPPEQQIEALGAWVTARGGVDAAVQALFDQPALAQADARQLLLEQKRTSLESSTDPWVSLAVALEQGFLEASRERAKARGGAMLRLRPVWVGAVREVLGGRSYPDANGTLRVTFGHVAGYAVRDGLWAAPRTRLAGIVEKDRLPDYEAPAGFLDQIAAARDPRYVDPELGDVPVNFLSDMDTTGGNSGSATLNAEGKLVGLVFDGNYESMAADWQFDTRTTRSVHIDIRYIGWMLSSERDGAWILTEMGW
jgi:hypothetical protein